MALPREEATTRYRIWSRFVAGSDQPMPGLSHGQGGGRVSRRDTSGFAVNTSLQASTSMDNLKFRSRPGQANFSAVAAAVLALGAASAHAYDITTSPYLLGDWGGLRTRLSDEGVAFNFGYGSELAHNTSG